MTTSEEGDAVAKLDVSRKYLSVDELEQISGISKWTWRRWAYNGRIESVKLGSRLMVPVSELERVSQEGTRPRLEAVSA